MTLERSYWIAAALGWLCVCPAGCVSPGGIEPDLITRYQHSVLNRSPQRRAGEKGLDLLRPISDTDAVPLKTAEDPKTKAARVELTLAQAIRLALLNSLDIRVVGFDPAISREAMVQAAAEFDYTVFGGVSHTIQDASTAFTFGAGKAHTTAGQVGVRKKTITGADVSLSWDLTRTHDNSAFATLRRRYESQLALEITQPLLRNAWPDYNLAGLEVARIGEKVSFSQFRQKVEQIVTEVQTTYWSLAQARREVVIQQRLLDKTIETLDRVKKRRELDATEVEVKQAEAAVETRRATLLRAKKTVGDVQDLLVRLLADERLDLLGKYVVIPTTPPVASKVTVDSADQLVNALRHSPLLEQARLSIETADVNVRVARNETLPSLDLTASVTFDGLKEHAEKAVNEMLSEHFVSWRFGATFEYPIGNRQPKSVLRQRKFERLQAVTEMQNLADQIAVAINEAVRQIETTFSEIKANRAAVAASRAQLQALEDTEKIRGRLTPEFLQVKLSAQEFLASAERAELQATMDLTKALAGLAQITGTTLKKHNIRLAAEAAADYGAGRKGAAAGGGGR